VLPLERIVACRPADARTRPSATTPAPT
jgi:hypothetical protein